MEMRAGAASPPAPASPPSLSFSNHWAIHHHSYITLQLVAHLGTFVLLALELFFSLGPHQDGLRLRPSNKPDLTWPSCLATLMVAHKPSPSHIPGLT